MNSIWMKKTPIPEFPALERNVSTQVLVIGGGLAGLLCAWQISRQGGDCLLIEADRICQGISGHTTAKVTSQHGLVYHKLLNRFGAKTARLYWLMNQEALGEYEKLSHELDISYETRNNYVFDSANPEKMVKELSALDQLEIPASFVKPLPVPSGEVGGICFSNQGQMDPVMLAAGISRNLRIYEHTAAREFRKNQVVTDRGTISAEKIIVATHFPILNKHGLYPLKLYQYRAYVLALEGVEPLNGMYLDCAKKGVSLRSAGEWLLLGGAGHRTGKPGRGWKDLERFAREHFPQARLAVRWAAQDCMSLDELPYIGPYSSTADGIYTATGFNKWGMTCAMAASMILADQIAGRKNPYEDIVYPGRTILRHQLAINTLEAVGGLVTPMKPRCPHLGCALKWNPWEHSWDCPCHGSRFSEDGLLLDNPATGDLER